MKIKGTRGSAKESKSIERKKRQTAKLYTLDDYLKESLNFEMMKWGKLKLLEYVSVDGKTHKVNKKGISIQIPEIKEK